MNKVYINSIASISAQRTFDNTEFLNDVILHTETVLPVVNPNYKDFIPAAAARRHRNHGPAVPVQRRVGRQRNGDLSEDTRRTACPDCGCICLR